MLEIFEWHSEVHEGDSGIYRLYPQTSQKAEGTPILV